MRRLEVESSDLAARFRRAGRDEQKRLAELMTERALRAFEPPLELPDDDAGLKSLVDELDAVGEEGDRFRRARVAAAAMHLRRGQFEDALYESLHGRADTPAGIVEALSAIE